MKFFPDSMTFLKIGSLSIRWYAVLILVGALVAYFFCRKDAKEARYIEQDFFGDTFIFTLWVGIIGARIWFCLFNNFSYYFSNPINILKIYDGGLAIHGGIIFGIIFCYIYCKKHGYNFYKIADCILPNTLIGQAIGRWGNFINKECHGPEVSEEYFNGFLSFLKEGMHIGDHYYEPLFFYESMLCLLGFLLIRLVFRKNNKRRGNLCYLYMMWYGIIRIYIETKRTDSLYIGKLKVAQIVSLVLIIVGILGYLGVFKKITKDKDKPIVIFDFDGTLVDTRQAIIESYKHLFEKFDKIENFTEERQLEVIGPPIRDLFPKYFPNYDVEMLAKEFGKYQNEIRKYCNTPNPHSRTILENLHTRGYHVAIVSGRNKESICQILEDYGFDEYVEDVIGCFEVTNLKPAPDAIFKLMKDNKWFRDDVIVVGDSSSDINMGKNYGAYTIGYMLHADKSEKIKDDNADTYITDLYDILDITSQDRYFTYNGK